MTHTLDHASRREAVDYIFRNIVKPCGCGKKTTWSCKRGSGLSHTHGIDEMGWKNGNPIGYVSTSDKEVLAPYSVALRYSMPHCPLPRKVEGKWRTLELETSERYLAEDKNWYTSVHPLG